MKKILVLFIAILNFASCATAQDAVLEQYLLTYDYQARKDMRVDSEELVQLIKTKKAILLDIRFKEEYQSWNMPFAVSIPLPDLPNNLSKLDKNKLIITACPHNDRAIIAMLYLKTKGYKVKYLSDGLLTLADYLRGNNALNFITN